MTRCESRVSTRLRYVHKSVQISGSPTKVLITHRYYVQRESVEVVYTESNVLNGASIVNATESGAVLPH
jgi:hypothetical protein